MSRILLLLSLCILALATFPYSEASDGQPVRRRVVKRSLESVQSVEDQGHRVSQGRPRTASEFTATITNESPSIHSFHLQISPQSLTSSAVSVPASILAADCDFDGELMTVVNTDSGNDLDSFEIDWGFEADNVHILPVANPQIVADVDQSQIVADVDQSQIVEKTNQSLFEPFRADVNGKTVIVIPNHEDSTSTKYPGYHCISNEAFMDHFITLCGLNSLFEELSFYTKDHFLSEKYLRILELDLESMESISMESISMESISMESISMESISMESDHVVLPPLHPIYALAREVLVISVIKGKLEWVDLAIQAGMNMNFKIFIKNNTKYRTNLLILAGRHAETNAREMLDLLTRKTGIELNAYDSNGFTLLHHLAAEDKAQLFETVYKASLSLPSPFKLDLNIRTIGHGSNAPIHLAAFKKNFTFLKPFIYLPNVAINSPDGKGDHLIHHAIHLKSFGFFSDLLKHSRIILTFNCVKKCFQYIRQKIQVENLSKYYEVLAEHLLSRRFVDISHLHYMIYFLIYSENISALEAFKSKGFDFSFTHKSKSGRPDSSPLNLAIIKDRSVSLQFLLGLLPHQPHELVFTAISSNSLKIIQFVLETIKFPDNLLQEFLKIVLIADSVPIFDLFVGEFGLEKIWSLIDRQENTWHSCPNIFFYQSIFE